MIFDVVLVCIDLFLLLKEMSSQTLYREDTAHSPSPPTCYWFLPCYFKRCVSIKYLGLVPTCNQNIFYRLEREDVNKECANAVCVWHALCTALCW